MDEGGEEPKERVVDFTGLAWGRVGVQTGITTTQVEKGEGGWNGCISKW